jgi:cytochrome c5
MHAFLALRHRFLRLSLVVAGAGVTLAACSPQSPPPASGQRAQATPADSQANHVNIDEIFPAGRGRDLLLNNCTSCHTFVPIVVLQMDKDAWERNRRIHRSRVPALSDADVDVLYQYLVSNFNPNRPVPTLPKELLATWTSY